MEVAPDSSHSALLKGCSEQKQLGMITKYHSESPFTFVMFSEVTEVACEERDILTPTDSFHSAESIEQKQPGQTTF